MMAAGPDFAPGEVKGMTIMEVAPTLAVLMGLPVADEWPGRVETSLLRENFFEDYPLETVRNYRNIEVEQGEVGSDQAAEQQNMRSLRGLGYVGEGVELAADADAGEYDFWSAERRLIVREMMMEIVYYLLNGDIDVANESFALLAENRPDLVKTELLSIQYKFEELISLLPEGDIEVAAFDEFMSQH
jgi:hypothetical protein